MAFYAASAASSVFAATATTTRTKVAAAFGRSCRRVRSPLGPNRSSSSLRVLCHGRPIPFPPFSTAHSSTSTTITTAATISVGDRLPDATLSYFDSKDELQTTTVSELTKGKKTIFFAVPGAFTPTCSQKHLPGVVEKAAELRAKGVDTLVCVSVNDAFVMKAWKKDQKIGDEVLLLSDGNLEFTKALGVELDLSDKPVGLGVRSRRYALLADDGVVKHINLEEGGAFTISSAEDMLKAL